MPAEAGTVEMVVPEEPEGTAAHLQMQTSSTIFQRRPQTSSNTVQEETVAMAVQAVMAAMADTEDTANGCSHRSESTLRIRTGPEMVVQAVTVVQAVQEAAVMNRVTQVPEVQKVSVVLPERLDMPMELPAAIHTVHPGTQDPTVMQDPTVPRVPS